MGRKAVEGNLGRVRNGRIDLRLGEAAERRFDRGETLALARGDAMRFFEALAAPPPLNDRLRAALEEHVRRVDSH